MTDAPFVTFHQLYPDGPPPCAADATLGGSIPLRAFRHCEPMTAASGFGWYLFAPIDFSLLSDGDVVYWKVGLEDRWTTLDHPVVLPGFAADCVDHNANELQRHGTPPFLGRGQEPNIVQLWGGLLARTRPGWSLSVRPLANFPRDSRFEVLDGLVQTDWWFGPLVTPLRIRKTDEPIRFLRTQPFCQLQPVLTDSYTLRDNTTFVVHLGLDAMSEADWARYRESLPAPDDPTRGPHGSYKRRARRLPRGHDS